jgi:hypothetical protein
MGVLVRTILIWLLVLALPVQGAAAATMAFCDPGHAAMGSALQGPPSGHHHAHHAHSHSAHAGAGHANDARSPATEVQAHVADFEPSADVAKLVHADEHRCSSCAACCSPAVAHSAVLCVPAVAVGATAFVAETPTVEEFAGGGPDRPPRILFV